MANAKAGAWRYTAGYSWSLRSVGAVRRALGSLARPMPPWLRVVVARGLLRRTALHADAQGIWGSAEPLAAGPDAAGLCPCPWRDVADVVVWDYGHLRIIGLARRGEAVGAGPAAKAALAPRVPQQPGRRRAFRRHPSYPAFIAPDGSPYDIGNVLTTNGWCVDVGRLQATVRHFAPRARFVDLTGVNAAPEAGGALGSVVEMVAGLFELVGWRRLGWLLGAAASAAVLALAAANLGAQSGAPIGVVVGALALAGFAGRAVVVRRRRRRSAHPEAWLDAGREDAEGSPLAWLRRGRVARWRLRVSLRAGGRTGGRRTGGRRQIGARRLPGHQRGAGRLRRRRRSWITLPGRS